jgi:hypothetical protein
MSTLLFPFIFCHDGKENYIEMIFLLLILVQQKAGKKKQKQKTSKKT